MAQKSSPKQWIFNDGVVVTKRSYEFGDGEYLPVLFTAEFMSHGVSKTMTLLIKTGYKYQQNAIINKLHDLATQYEQA